MISGGFSGKFFFINKRGRGSRIEQSMLCPLLAVTPVHPLSHPLWTPADDIPSLAARPVLLIIVHNHVARPNSARRSMLGKAPERAHCVPPHALDGDCSPVRAGYQDDAVLTDVEMTNSGSSRHLEMLLRMSNLRLHGHAPTGPLNSKHSSSSQKS